MKKHFLFLACPLLVILFLTNCRSISNQPGKQTNTIHRTEKGASDFDEAMAYEFNMIKNPATGTIPDGSFSGELAQAKAILAGQGPLGPQAANVYTFQGPGNLGGRTRTILYDKSYNGTSNRIIYAGGVSGGVYKSTDDGATWVRKSPTGEHFSCTSIAQGSLTAASQDTLYYGVGEASGNSAGGTGASYSGNGVYRSIDRGETWARLTTSNVTAIESFTVAQDYINKVIVDPTDGYVYIACPATIRRSVDGGTTWTTVLSGALASSGQFTDIVVSSTGRLYAAFGGTNSSTVDGVWASAPGATSGDPASWTQIAGAGAGGSPAGWNSESFYGRVVLVIPPTAETFLYALYYGGTASTCGAPLAEAELFRYDDGGGTWTDLSATMPDEAGCSVGNDPFACQGGYDLVVAVKPGTPSTIFIGGTNLYRSTDAGLSWTRIGGYASSASYAIYTGSHPDIHAIAFQPTSPGTMLCGNDGGIQRTTDNTAATVAWTAINTGYRTYQYYYVTLDPRIGNDKVLGGAQDNGSTRNIGGTGTSFESVMGGDGVSVGLSDLISAIQYEYVGFQLGDIIRRMSTDVSGSGTIITPPGESGTGLFVTLFKLDVDNSDILYYANDEALYRTTSASTVASGSWTSMTGIATAVGAVNDITALATTRGTYSAATASLFMGTSNGKVYRLDDPAFAAAGTGPVNITGAGFPAAAFVSSIAVNPRNDDTIMVTFSNYGVTSVWWTGTANSAVPTWTSVEGTLTLPSYRSSAIAVTSTGVDYFIGTSVGLYTSAGLPGAVAWVQEGPTDVGNAVVSSLALRKSDNKLLVGTHGYGMWSTFLSLSIVPVTLTNFTGQLQNKQVLLQWTTSAEYNSKQFEVERSFDGINFEKIGVVPAAGNSNTVRQYNYVDRSSLTENNYYRLRTVDINGGSKLSNVVLIKLPDAQQNLIVMGNPFRNGLIIRFVKPADDAGSLSLFDMTGKLLVRQAFAKGEQQIQFRVPAGLSSAAYQVKAMVNGKLISARVLKD